MRQQPQVRPLAMPHGQRPQTARQGKLGHVRPFGTVHVDHRHAILGHQPGEKCGLGVEIGLHRVVIIQMILRQVSEPRRRQAHAIHPALIQTMA